MATLERRFAILFSALCLGSASCGGEEPSGGPSTTGPGTGNTGGSGSIGTMDSSSMSASTTSSSQTSSGSVNTGGMSATTAATSTTSSGGMGTGGTGTGTGTGTGGTGTGGMTAGIGTGTTDGAGGTSASGGASSTGGAGATGGTGGTSEPELHVYLALGQSNMQGAAHVPDEPIFHSRVQVLQGQNCPASDGHSYGYGEWREMFTPMIRCYEGTRDYPGASGPIGLGPADSFAVAMAEEAGPNVTIGIVGAAYGGTDIQAHLPDCGSQCKPPFGDVSGAPVVNGTTPIYAWIKDLATKAQEVGTIKGIIFHHGENNSGQQSWLTHVNTYITSLRNDLGLDPAEVPFVAGELPRTGCCASHNAIVQQIPDFVENGHWVSSGPMGDGTVLGDRGDSLHWSTFSVIEMGKRYAAKMLEAQGK